MRQLSLLATHGLAGVVPALRAAMRRVASSEEGEGRKALADMLTALAQQEGISLTGGNAKGIGKDSLDKLLNPNAPGWSPSVNFVLAFCKATGDVTALREMLRPFDLDIMTEEDRRYRDIGRADVELKAARKRKKFLEETL